MHFHYVNPFYLGQINCEKNENVQLSFIVQMISKDYCLTVTYVIFPTLVYYST